MKNYDKPEFEIVTFVSEETLVTTSNGTGNNLGVIGEIDYSSDVIS
ncbi:MAG: hypothetical protein IJ583_09450 [Firmicutes bacterium]|nr:hypothetical protein [Bacillota bacterium]